MTYLRNIILPFLLLLSFVGCTQDEAENVVPGEIRLTLNIAGALPSKSITADEGESKITNVYLLFYKTGAGDGDTPAYFYSQTEMDLDGSWSNKFNMADMPKFEANANYDIYALASLPTDEVPTETTTKETLLTLQEKRAERVISFSGMSTYTPGKQEITISLKRTVARLDITIDNIMDAKDLSLTMAKEPSSVFYLKEQTENTITDSNRQATQTNGRYRFYLYEHIADSHPVWIYFRGTTKEEGKPIFHLIEVKPEGSSQIKRNHIYNLTLTLREGDITVSTGTTLDWGETIAVSPEMTGIILKESSNTYILPPNSNTIAIPVNRPNLAKAVIPSIPVIEENEKLEAELVWTDAKGASSGLASDASIAKIEISGNGPEAYLLVTPGSKEGNSVIAVKDKKGTIKWSWHIWVTLYDPETTLENTNGNIDGHTFMDRNLGALNSSPYQDYPIGTYYQWGRFHPFPTKQSGNNNYKFVSIYNALGNTITLSSSVSKASIDQLISQPLAFSDGTYSYNYNLWDKDKTVFDPCPTGWCVGTIEFWGKINTVNTLDNRFIAGYQITNSNPKINLPVTWSISSTNGVFQEGTSPAYHWSCEKKNNTEINYHFIELGNSPVINTIAPERGLPVRCMRQRNK